MTALPILDLAEFRRDESSAAAGEFVRTVRETCHTVGFFYLTGHGVPDEVNQRVRLATSMTNAPHFRGYAPPGGDGADPANPIFATYGENILKMRLRAHPAVARRHHADLADALS
jgi:isopenicillin N synthase-like dioxygenase